MSDQFFTSALKSKGCGVAILFVGILTFGCGQRNTSGSSLKGVTTKAEKIKINILNQKRDCEHQQTFRSGVLSSLTDVLTCDLSGGRSASFEVFQPASFDKTALDKEQIVEIRIAEPLVDAPAELFEFALGDSQLLNGKDHSILKIIQANMVSAATLFLQRFSVSKVSELDGLKKSKKVLNRRYDAFDGTSNIDKLCMLKTNSDNSQVWAASQTTESECEDAKCVEAIDAVCRYRK